MTIITALLCSLGVHAAKPDFNLRRQFDPTRLSTGWTAEREAAAARRLERDGQPPLAGLSWSLLTRAQRADLSLDLAIEKVVDVIADPRTYTQPWPRPDLSDLEWAEVELVTHFLAANVPKAVRDEVRARLTDYALHIDARVPLIDVVELSAEAAARLLGRAQRARLRGDEESVRLNIRAALLVIARGHLILGSKARAEQISARRTWRGRIHDTLTKHRATQNYVVESADKFWRTIKSSLEPRDDWHDYRGDAKRIAFLFSKPEDFNRVMTEVHGYLGGADPAMAEKICADMLSLNLPKFDEG